jgi:hypothetical protein
MIALNRPQPFIFIWLVDMPCKQCFTTQNQAKLLSILKLRVTQLDRPLEAVKPPGALMSDWQQGTPVRPPWGPSLTGLPSLSWLLPNLSVNTCPPYILVRLVC